MSKTEIALTGVRLHDGATFRPDQDLCVNPQGGIAARPARQDGPKRALPPGVVMPGFVDLQVNGGGGRMLGAAPDIETIGVMADAHARLGTRAFLPTLITDTPEKTTAAIAATEAAIATGVPGVVGLHLEGPHLDPRRKGAHPGALIRPMTPADLEQLLDAAARLPNLLVTVAPEAATPAQINALADAGVIVSLGHSDCSFEVAMRAFDAGARMVTHLFNAMSPLAGRAPGLVGAALARSDVAAGLIADGHHVHPGAMSAALAAKPGRMFLVSDAMAVAGSDLARFTLAGREIRRADGRLTLADGTLAGADLSLGEAVLVLTRDVGVPLEEALALACRAPAMLLRNPGVAGRIDAQVSGMVHFVPETGAVTPLETLLAA